MLEEFVKVLPPKLRQNECKQKVICSMFYNWPLLVVVLLLPQYPPNSLHIDSKLFLRLSSSHHVASSANSGLFIIREKELWGLVPHTEHESIIGRSQGRIFIILNARIIFCFTELSTKIVAQLEDTSYPYVYRA